MGPSETLLIFLYVFLVICGAISIIAALVRVVNPRIGKDTSSDSSIEVKGFKFNAPVGFVFGITAILLVVIIVKFDHNKQLRNLVQTKNKEIVSLKEQNERMKRRIASLAAGNEDSMFVVKVSGSEPHSLFNGSVLVIYDYKPFSPSTVEFKGAIGVSKGHTTGYATGPKKIAKGDRLFVKIAENEIWGINVLKVTGNLSLEFFRP